MAFLLPGHEACERNFLDFLVTAPYGVVAYFYGVGPTWFSHGPTVSDVLRGRGIEWRWSVEGLADLFALEHLTGCMTLHAGVKRTPAGSLLGWIGHFIIGVKGCG